MSSNRLHANSYLSVDAPKQSLSGKTLTWRVRNLAGVDIGSVRWHAQWRKYAFFSYGGVILEQDCLRDLAEFVEDKTIRHRRKGT